MRPPAKIVAWLPGEELLQWVREAPDKSSYQRRLAVWLTYLGELSAQQVAEYLGVSKQAVWLWVGQYNREGPGGLARVGRGGRRWALLSWEEEEAFLEQWHQKAAVGEVLTVHDLHQALAQRVGRKVSLAYVYRLLHRHGWRKLGPRPHHPKRQPELQEEFKKNSPRSCRKR